MDCERKSDVYRRLWLANCFGYGNNRLWDILDGFDSFEDAYNALSNDSASRRALLTPREIQQASRIENDQIESVISYCEENGIGILCFSDEAYPSFLREIYNPPSVLFYRGDLSCLERELVLTVVGTRAPLNRSLEAAGDIIGELCKYNTTIISGFAVGVDIASHLAAVESGGKTVAVLGCGLDVDYPFENGKYRKIIEGNGVFISEFFPSSKPAPHFFPQRNRILSGLSLGTVIVEAGEKSGSLVTANLALNQGRDIFCFSPPVCAGKEFGGNIGLLRDGAIPVYDHNDILYEYYENHSHRHSDARGDLLTEISLSDSVKKRKTKLPDTTKNVPDISSFTEDERRVLELLIHSPVPIRSDDICEGCGMSVQDVLMTLTDLEMSGAISQYTGQTYKANF